MIERGGQKAGKHTETISGHGGATHGGGSSFFALLTKCACVW